MGYKEILAKEQMRKPEPGRAAKANFAAWTAQASVSTVSGYSFLRKCLKSLWALSLGDSYLSLYFSLKAKEKVGARVGCLGLSFLGDPFCDRFRY